MPTDIRVLMLGGNGSLATAALRTLRAAGAKLVGLVVYGFSGVSPASVGQLPVRPPPRPTSLAASAKALGLPVIHVDDLQATETRERLAALQADVLLSVCFPRLMPPWLRYLPALACLNLHPSLLPAYRGPAPIFWQLRSAEPNTGVTLHEVTATLDAGPVLARREVLLGDGWGQRDIGDALGGVGAQLFLQALASLANDTARFTAQDEQAASHQSTPQALDFSLDRDWSARHAFNFMRGTDHWCKPYAAETPGGTLWFQRAHRLFDGCDNAEHLAGEGRLAIAFRDGSLIVEPSPPPDEQ